MLWQKNKSCISAGLHVAWSAIWSPVVLRYGCPGTRKHGSVSSSVSGTCRLRLTIIAFGEIERHYRPLMIVWLLIYHIRMRIAILRQFGSWSITSGNCQCAFYGPLCHFPLFLIYHIRSKIPILRQFGSWSITSGNRGSSLPAKSGCEVFKLCLEQIMTGRFLR